MIHELKCDSDAFTNSQDGYKPYEIRLNDRNFQSGDTILLRETVHTAAEMAAGAPLEYTGRELWMSIVMIHPYMAPYLLPGYVAMTVVPQPWASEGNRTA